MLPNLSLRGGRRPTWQSRRTMVDNRWASAKTKPLAGDSHVASLLGMTHQGSAVMHQCPCAVESSRAWRSLSAATDAIGAYIFSAAYTSPRLPQPLWGLAMTNLEALRGRRCHPITCQPARRAGSAAAGAVESHHPFNGAIILYTRRGTAACGRFSGGGTARPACRILPRRHAPEK